ncbi:MAG: hypothetical protein J6N49_06245 [Alphaproteobacteria bacterium]|nr:hypothetical protein [Alphaproteobacteria bacterium]
MADIKYEETDDEREDKKDAQQKNGKSDKKGFDNNERLTLKINVQEAEQYSAEKGKKKISALPKNMKKLRKKVRDSYDEEDDGSMDEDVIRSLQELQINQTDASNGDNTLINSLSENERRQIMQNTNIEITRHEQDAGRQDALEHADTKLRQAGLRKMTTDEFTKEMQDAIYNPSRLRREALAHNITEKLGIEGNVTKHNEGKIVEGVRKVRDVTENRKVKSLKMDDVKNIAQKNMSQNETAELILKKSGQTARLSEIKHQTTSRKPEDKQKSGGKSYSVQMKELLKESLKKNDKVR